MKTIEEAKKNIKDGFYKGKVQTCPCCSQLIKYYKRKITSSAARILINLYNTIPEGEFSHIEVFGEGLPGHGGGDFSKIRYWGFIEEMINISTSKKNSGMWRITPAGRDFCRRKIKASKYALVYNNKVWGFDKEEVDIVDCLGQHFDYFQLMQEF